MKKVISIIKENSAKVQASFSTIIKLILIVSIGYSIALQLWRILFINLLLLIVLLMPYLLKSKLSIKIPREFELILLTFIVISFFLGDIRGIIVQIFFGAALGFIGFLIMLIIFVNSRIKTSYMIIALFSISLSVALGLALEIAKYYLKIYSGYTLSITDYNYAITSLTLVGVGALISSIIGFFYVKGYRLEPIEKLAKKFIKTNPNLFIQKTDSPEEILELIKKGESEKIEFKSTLRVNTYTNDIDRNIEKATLKTIVALMNSEGGTLLIGVTDSGNIEGLKRDRFETNDKLSLHFTNLIKEYIGNEYLPYINFEIVLIEKNYILLVNTIKADKPVFLREGKNEEFFIRIGPASVQITGKKLVDYIQNHFRN